MSLNSNSEKALREIFGMADLDGDGSLTANEFKRLAKSVGLNLSKEHMNKLMRDVDSDNSGQVEFSELVAVMGREINPDKLSSEEAEAIFASFCRPFTPKGLILMEDLHHLLLHVLKLDATEVRNLLKQLEISLVTIESGKEKKTYFNYGEYISFMTSTPTKNK